jgi:hypothetical protein
VVGNSVGYLVVTVQGQGVKGKQPMKVGADGKMGTTAGDTRGSKKEL